MKQRRLKYFYILSVLLLILIIFSITIKKENTATNNHLSELDIFENKLKEINSYNEHLLINYYNEYKKSNNLIKSLNVVNHPEYYNENIKEISPNIKSKSHLTLVNKKYYLNENYILDNLSIIENVKKIHRVDEIMMMEKDAYNAYLKLYEKAKQENIELVIYSAYRTISKQKDLYNNSTSRLVAYPGHSEHQTGLAVDISTLNSGLTIHFENTDSFKFLNNYAHEYGFILRYPKNKENITGYNYEPWHYRYVGINHAKIIKENNLTLEEYLYSYIPL